MSRSSLTRILIVLAAALLAGLAVVLLVGDDEFSLTAGQPEIVTLEELESYAAQANHPIYWLGERTNRAYELTQTKEDRVFVRYLPAGTEASDPSSRFLTVGTYPVRDAEAALERTVREADDREMARSDDGAAILIDTGSPLNAHFAYPGEDLQIEIFSPVPGRALRLASSDRVRPVP